MAAAAAAATTAAVADAPILPTLAEIEEMTPFVDSVVPPTPQYTWPLLNLRTGCELWVKHENHTPLGAFKVRGGLAYFKKLLQREPELKGVIAATRGNHGQSVVFAAKRVLGSAPVPPPPPPPASSSPAASASASVAEAKTMKAVIVVPHGNSVEKNAAMRALGAELIEHGPDFQTAFEYAMSLAKEQGLHPMPSYHRDLVLGISVSTLRFLRSTPVLDRIYVPIGMGSGVCAMIAARDALQLPTRIVGVVSTAAPMYALSFAAKEAVSHPASTRIADGMACSTPHPEALKAILAGVERIVQVTDDEVEAAMRAYFTDTHNVAEGAAGAALAAVLQEKALNEGKKVGVVLSGGNVDRNVFARILTEG